MIGCWNSDIVRVVGVWIGAVGGVLGVGRVLGHCVVLILFIYDTGLLDRLRGQWWRWGIGGAGGGGWWCRHRLLRWCCCIGGEGIGGICIDGIAITILIVIEVLIRAGHI